MAAIAVLARDAERGKYAVDPVKLAGPPSSFHAMRAALASAAGSKQYGDAEFEIVVQYVEEGEEAITIQLEGCVWTGNTSSNEEGADPLKEEIELDARRITRNDLALYDETDDPFERDYILLSGKRSPGLAEIVGAGTPRNWDKRKGYGLMGATTVFHGMDLAEFSVKLRLYTRQDFADWAAWKPLVDKPPVGTLPRSLDITHPLLEQLDIKSVVVQDVSQPEQTDDGEWTIEIKLLQWRQPVVRLAKPEGSTAAPVDPVEQEIGGLLDQANDLAAQ